MPSRKKLDALKEPGRQTEQRKERKKQEKEEQEERERETGR